MNEEKCSKEEHEELSTIQTTYSLTSKNVHVTIKINTFDTVYAGFDYCIECPPWTRTWTHDLNPRW